MEGMMGKMGRQMELMTTMMQMVVCPKEMERVELERQGVVGLEEEEEEEEVAGLVVEVLVAVRKKGQGPHTISDIAHFCAYTQYSKFTCLFFLLCRQQKARRLAHAQRANLPNKPTNFQIRVHIHEARKLVGSGINPVSKVLLSGDVKESSTQKGTNNPTYNDVLFFNLHCLPEEMFNKLVEVKVLNAKKVIRDSLIGSFKFDLGLVYDESSHCFIHKWLLLVDPEDAAGGVKVRCSRRDGGGEGGGGFNVDILDVMLEIHCVSISHVCIYFFYLC